MQGSLSSKWRSQSTQTVYGDWRFTYLFRFDLRLPQLDRELDEFAVLLDQLPELLVVSQFFGILLQKERHSGPPFEVPRLFGGYLQIN